MFLIWTKIQQKNKWNNTPTERYLTFWCFELLKAIIMKGYYHQVFFGPKNVS